MSIKNGVIQGSSINGVPFKASIVVPKGKNNARTLRKLTKTSYIAMHGTANTAKSADAEMHAKYIQNVENADQESKSWHITVDEDSAVQHIPLNEVTYHAGDGSGPGNTQSISIEMCVNGNVEKTIDNAIKIVAYLQKEYNLADNKVKPHLYFSPYKKVCPSQIIKSVKTWEADWAKFIARLDKYKNPAKKTATKAKPNVVSKAGLKDIVKVKSSTTHWNTGQKIPSFVYNEKYAVIQVKGDTLLLSKNDGKKIPTGWVKATDVTVIK